MPGPSDLGPRPISALAADVRHRASGCRGNPGSAVAPRPRPSPARGRLLVVDYGATDGRARPRGASRLAAHLPGPRAGGARSTPRAPRTSPPTCRSTCCSSATRAAVDVRTDTRPEWLHDPRPRRARRQGRRRVGPPALTSPTSPPCGRRSRVSGGRGAHRSRRLGASWPSSGTSTSAGVRPPAGRLTARAARHYPPSPAEPATGGRRRSPPSPTSRARTVCSRRPPASRAGRWRGDESLYDEADADYEAFWARQARELLTGRATSTPPSSGSSPTPSGSSAAPSTCPRTASTVTWPPDGDKVAFHWEGEPGDTRTITYADLLDEVSRFANVLKALGVERGDRVAVYMPMIPELPVALLACTRIGAAHSVIFGGFSPDSIVDRVNDGGCKVIVTADGGVAARASCP